MRIQYRKCYLRRFLKLKLKNKKEVKKFRFGFSDSFIVISLIHHYMPDSKETVIDVILVILERKIVAEFLLFVVSSSENTFRK